MSLARKYRPSTFTDLIGQDAVSKTLSLALENSKLSHAYLFSGIRGSGKTSTARIFAKALLCEKGPTNNPCQKCEQCIMANEGRHIDIIEMDAASNRGIEDIKELIEHTKYKPSIGRFKIFIIDEVHMLTVQAFNALLKTLEEPPEFVKFILATTDPLKLPATILSRVQHFRFKKLPIKTVKEHLSYILHKEGVEFEDEALEIIARSGQGSVRDALTLLDQAIVYANGKITTNSVTNMLGIIDPETINNLLKSISTQNRDEVLKFLKKSLDYEAEMIIDEITLYLQNALLNQNTEFSTLVIDRFFRILSDAKRLLSFGSNSEFVLSLTLFKMIEAMNIHSIDDMIHKLQSELSGQIDNINKPSYTQNTNTQIKNTQINEANPKNTQTEEINKTTDTKNLFKILEDKIYDRNYELGEIFKNNIKFISFKNNILTWESTAEGDDKKRLIENWSILRLFVQEVFGIDTKIENLSKKKSINKPKDNEETLNSNKKEEIKSPQKNSSIMIEGNSEATKDKDPKDLLNEPMIQEFIKYFEPKRVIVKQKS